MQTENTYGLQKAAYDIHGLREIMPIGRTAIYDAIKSGVLRKTKCGKRTIFLRPDVEAFLNSLQQAGANA
jgi:hypothetical protein